jgi:hypothetical protein
VYFLNDEIENPQYTRLKIHQRHILYLVLGSNSLSKKMHEDLHFSKSLQMQIHIPIHIFLNIYSIYVYM